MPLYTKQSLQMLVDLINASNPTLPVPLTPTNVLYGTPAAVTPSGGNIQNTSIKVTAMASTKYVGNTTLNYRRIDFGTLFRSLPIVIYKYSPAAANAVPYKISDLLPSINAKYGLSLQITDLVDGSLPAGNTNAVPSIGLVAGTRNSSIVVSASTGSAGYIGTFTLYWVQAPQDIGNMISVTNLETARSYPGLLATVGSGLYVPDLDVFSYDFTTLFSQGAVSVGYTLTQFASFMATYSLGTVVGLPYNTALATVLSAIQTASGNPAYNVTSPASTPMSLFGIKFTSVALPNVAVPEANSKYFNHCIYADLPAANSWGAGRLILHFNV